MSEETGLSRYQEAVLSEIVAAVGDPTATLESIADHMNTIYADAQERGDQRSMEIISSSWQYVEQFAAVQGHTLNLAAAARELAEITSQQRDEIRGTLAEIRDALEEGDENHPELQDFAATIREEAEEYVQETMFDELIDYAFQNQDETFHDALVSLCEHEEWPVIEYTARCYLVERLRGEIEFLPEQKDLFRQIIEIEMKEQEKREKEREEQMLKWKQQAADELAKRATGAAS